MRFGSWANSGPAWAVSGLRTKRSGDPPTPHGTGTTNSGVTAEGGQASILPLRRRGAESFASPIISRSIFVEHTAQLGKEGSVTVNREPASGDASP